ncbi:hypothetical protein F2P56_006914 [Juglans regia]|uniref:Nitrate regulatory gene2 protein-like n=2 Tax=Juglans regia TaxID=51240 RepID=A0A833Y2W6_JUGRE|nr:protein ALTERED PHOSPHATE STARVATION RESPONSE 1 [Juglans regia]KAF5475069.1 hypothetical protein F2P56_006914 [Juglans regia]
MGCVASRIDTDERVQICKERKKLMKQLVGFRGEFADALLAYLRALKDTGVTLRQFTESESLELENTSYALTLPPSPPPPPYLRKNKENNWKEKVLQKESIEIEEDDSSTPSSPPPLTTQGSCSYWDPFGSSSQQHHLKKSEVVELVGDEKWAETKTEFDEEDQKEGADLKIIMNPLLDKPQPVELVDDNSSTMSCCTKDTADIAMVVRSKKTLEGIVGELDDYFLKASAAGKEIAVVVDINGADNFPSQGFKENDRKNSAKVFSALSWSRSSKSLQVTKEAVEPCGSSEPCRPGAHCITLKKLHAAEQRLYKEMKEEEITKLEHQRKSFMLQKQEDENHDWTKTEKTRLSVESLEADMVRLQQSISKICSSILELIDEELYPQLVALTSGLMQMWKTMYECHQVQIDISKQLNYLHDNAITDFSTDFHRQATAQLETEISYWFNSFCKLIKSQRGYVRTLCRWIQLTEHVTDGHQHSSYSSVVHSLCEVWQVALDKLPDKVASEAIKSFLSAIHSVLLQQVEECNQQKKYEKLERRVQKESDSLVELEKKLEGSFADENTVSNLSPKHPLSLKRAKTEALKKQKNIEEAKYLNAVNVTRAMTLKNLKTSLPVVFQALMAFSRDSVRAMEGCSQPRETGS